MKIQLCLEGDPKGIQDILLEVAQYVTDNAVTQLGLNLKVNNAVLKGNVEIFKEDSEKSAEQLARTVLRDIWLTQELLDRQIIIDAATARLAAMGMEFKSARQLTEHIMATEMI